MVYEKIMHINSQMKSTYDWCNGSKTGVGLKDSDPLSFNEKVRWYSNCHFYCDNISINHSSIATYE